MDGKRHPGCSGEQGLPGHRAPVRGDAWGELAAEFRPLVSAIATREYRLGREDAEDLTQLVFVKLFQNLDALRDRGSFRHWLRAITRRAAIDFLRARRETESLDAPGMPQVASRDADLERAAARADLESALRALPELYRGPVRLYLEGCPQEEMSRRLGRPRGTVASQIHRGLALLRSRLSEG